MLSVYLGKMDEAVYYPPVYFDNRYEDEWITDKRSVEIIRDVDKSDVVSAHLIESPVLGPISPRELSGGVKTILLMLFYETGRIFNASACGDNCAKWIMKIAESKDLTINLRHIRAITCQTPAKIYDLPYSVEEIYGLHSSGKYQNTRKVYQQMYRIYSDKNILPIKPEKIIVEDSNSGYDFFRSVSEDQNLERLPTVLIL